MGILRFLFRAVVSGQSHAKKQKRRQGNQRPTSANRGNQPFRLPVFPEVGEFKGKCHVIDGDTIVIKRTKIRLAGVDAPEIDQPWGQKAKWAMVELCKGHVVTAKLNGERSKDRLVATCYLPDGRDIGAELIKQGLALDWGHFSGGRYRHLEPKGVRRKLRQAHLR
ncbi:MAG: thermonuclease family protein [Proteobacteria bacterium]|nr:thermonuclease family protein [Pseudomonadota bacterium]